MRTARVILRVASVVGVLTLVGCTGGAPAPEPGRSGSAASPSFGVEPTGSVVVIKPLDRIDGAERIGFEGLGIDVPAGMTATKSELANGSKQLQLREAGAARASVILTVTPEPKADTEAVDAASSVTASQLGASGVASDIVRSPATWKGIPYAVVITCVLSIASETGSAEDKDGFIVTLRGPKASQIVGVSAQAPAGQMASSDAFATIRSLRFDR